MKKPHLLLLATLSLLLGCGGGGGSSSDSAGPPPSGSPPPSAVADNAPPQVSSRSPAVQATDVAVTAEVQVVFNEALDPNTFHADTLVVAEGGTRIDGTLTLDEASNTLTFKALDDLAANTVYAVHVEPTLEDTAGNLFAGADWSFTTGGAFNLGATPQSTIDECMDEGDLRMLTLVNNSRAQQRECGNTLMPAQPALSWHCLLDAAASGHSQSMADNDFHAHVSPIDGSDPGDRIRATGYTPSAWGENIAAGYADEEQVMQAWLDSPGHCTNLMRASFTEMGAAFARNSNSTYGIYWTQKFARP